MSEPILCDGGLDLMTQRIQASPGTLRDCLNYEVDTQSGYSKVGGFARYDGRAYPARAPNVSWVDLGGSVALEIGETVTVEGVLVGTVLKTETVFPSDTRAHIDVTGTVAVGDEVIGANSGAAGIVLSVAAQAAPETAGDWLTEHLDHVDQYRGAVGPAGMQILGATYFRDRAWCVVNGGDVNYRLEDFPSNNPADNLPVLSPGGIVEVQEIKAPLQNAYMADLVDFQIEAGDFSQGEATVRVSLNNRGVLPEHSSGSGLDIEPLDQDNKIIQIWNLAEVEFESGSQYPETSLNVADAVSNTTGDGEAYISRIKTESGSWSGGDAAGRMWLRWAGEDIEAGDWEDESGSTFTISRIVRGNGKGYSTGSVTGTTELDGLEAPHLIRDTGAGWEAVDLGYEVQFEGGQNAADTVFDKTIAQTDTDEDPESGDWASPGALERLADGAGGSGWADDSGSSDDADIIDGVSASGGDYAVQSAPSSVNGLFSSSHWHDLGFDVDTLDSIVGVEVQVRVEAGSGNEPTWAEARLRLPDGTESTNKAPAGDDAPGTFTTFTFGGEHDNWGARLNPGIVNDPDFGFKLQFRDGGVPVPPGGADLHVDLIRVRLWTKRSNQRLFFRKSGADAAEADLVYYQITNGTFDDDDAEGVATIRNLTGDPITSGMDVYTEAGGAGNFLWTTASAAEPNSLPGLSDLEANDSRYQFWHDNFYAQDRLRAVYGVSGADFAFTFSDDYFFRIRTGFDNPDDDKPRHVITHGSRLMLGFGTGEVVFSVAGEPANFQGVSGAQFDSFSAPITGLLQLKGQSVAVLTSESVQVLQGTNPQTWAKQIISPQSGAIEYTAVDMGTPIYLDERGVSSIGATDQYGDFQRGRNSWAVQDWLIPRIQRLIYGRQEAVRPVVALPIRSKSQYLLFFADGMALSMTLHADGPPQFMLRQYKVDGEPLEILAAAEGQTSNGQDRAFFSHSGSPYLHELNRGLSFDGAPITGYLEFNTSWPDPSRDWTPEVIHVHGQVDNEGELDVKTISDYVNERSEDRLILRRDSEPYRDPVGFLGKSRAKTRGNCVALRLEHNPETVKPGHTIQAYSWLEPRRGRVNR